MEIQWSLVLFTAITGMGACLFSFAMLQALLGRGKMPGKVTCITSFAMLVVGGCISVTHIIHHLDRIVEALGHPTSGIFIEALGTGIMCLLIAVYFIMLYRKASDTGLKVVGTIAAIVGVVFAFECGNSYFMGSRPAWTTLLLPLGYCLTALAGGSAVNLLLKAVGKAERDEVAFAGKLCIIGSALGLVGAIAFAISAGGYVASAAGAIAWTALMIILFVATLLLGLYSYKKDGNAVSVGACATATAFVGVVAYRIVMWLVGTPVLDFFMMSLS